MWFETNEHDEKIKELAKLLKLKFVKHLGTDIDSKYHYYILEHDSGVYFTLFPAYNKVKQFNITIRFKDYEKHSQENKNNQFRTVSVDNVIPYNENDSFICDINSSMKKTPEKLCADINNRMMKSFNKAVSCYIEKKKEYFKRKKVIELSNKEFSKHGINFPAHSENEGYTHNNENLNADIYRYHNGDKFKLTLDDLDLETTLKLLTYATKLNIKRGFNSDND